MISTEQIMGVDDSHISPVGDSHFLLPEVRDLFYVMQEVAQNMGLDLQICSSFRSFDRQLNIWNRKWQGDLPLISLEGETLNADSLSDEEKIHAIMLWSALPGASRHHWGTDFDFYDKEGVEQAQHNFQLVSEEYEKQGPCAELARWVHEHAASYGFYLPYNTYVGGVAREPWHLSYQPLAEQIQRHFDIDRLANTLEQSAMQGKDVVLGQLDYLVKRYTYNKGLEA